MKMVFIRFIQSLLLATTACVGAWIALDATATPLIAKGYQTSSNSPAMLYRHYCSVCHGDQGNGQSRARASLNPPPTDFTNPVIARNLPRDVMIATVRDGRPGTAMVGWKTQLTAAQIAMLVDYVRQQFMEPNSKTSAANASGLIVSPIHSSTLLPKPAVPSTPTRLIGNVTNGHKLYAEHCVVCHGKNGEVNGNASVSRAVATSPQPDQMASIEVGTALNRSTLARPALIHAIALGKPGTQMAPWNKLLTNQEIADLAEFVFQRIIAASGTASSAKLR